MQFSFKHNTHALLPFLLKVNQYIQHNLTAGPYDRESLLSKCKLIVTELCTNGIKHAGTPESIFYITITNETLTIKRQDNGHAFSPVINGGQVPLPLPGNIDIVTLTEDDINRLLMQRISGYSARFYVENTATGQPYAPQKLNEHFGLIIICLSANNFTYTHHVQDNLNEFTAVVALV